MQRKRQSLANPESAGLKKTSLPPSRALIVPITTVSIDRIRVPMVNRLTLVLLVFTVGGAIILIGSYHTRRRAQGPAPKAKRGRKKKNALESQ